MSRGIISAEQSRLYGAQSELGLPDMRGSWGVKALYGAIKNRIACDTELGDPNKAAHDAAVSTYMFTGDIDDFNRIHEETLNSVDKSFDTDRQYSIYRGRSL